MIDAGARTSFVNPRMAQMLGYTVEEMLGRALTDFMDDASRASAEHNIERRKQGITEQHDFRFLRKDGSALWATLATGPILGSDGAYAGALAMITDITERKRIEEALRQSESRFRRIMESNMIGMFFCNIEGVISAANDAFLKMVGYTREDFDAGLVNWNKMTPSEYVHLDQRAIEELAAKGVCTPWEKEYFRKDGSRVAVYVGVAAFEGRTDEGVAFVMDISERKRAEKALRESETGFRQLVENAPEAVVLLDLATGKFSMVNPAAEILFKLTAAELCQLGPVQLSPEFQPDGQRTVEKAQGCIARALAGDAPVFEWMHRDSQGCDLACEVRLLRLKINDRDFVRGSVTELRKRNEAEVAIRESEEKFHAVFAQSPLAIVLTTLPEGLVADANAAAEGLLGRKIAEVRGLTTPQMNVWTHPEERDEYLQLLKRDGFVNDYEANMRRHDGSNLTVLYNGRVVRIGGRSYVLNSMLDITGRKKIEEAVRQNREQFIDLFDNAPIGYHEVDAEGRLTRINNTELKMLGYAADELTGQQVWKISVNETLSRETFFAKMNGTQPPGHNFERIFRRKDGTTFPVLIDDRILRNEDGVISGIRSVVQDITARKQAEAKAQHLANFPELNPNPVLEFSAAGELVYHNPAALSMAQKAGFATLKDLLPPRVKPMVAECLATGQPQLRFETKHGPHTLSWSFYPINDQQVVHCYVGDITTRLQLEEQFRQAQKMEAIGQLSGGVAHDFNNLLTVILGNIGLLQSSGLVTPELTEPLQAIGHAANRAANLTKQLLAFSRQQVMQQQNLDLNAVVGHISKMLRRVIGETVKIRLDYALQPLPIHADPGMLEQVILNLCINARDAMPQGGQLTLRTATVDISTAEARLMVTARAGSFALLIVSDTGTGISPENMKRVFEPFFTTKEVGKGTGLGLASVYGIAQQHNGWVAVESELGRGTTFTVYLPLLASSPSRSPQPAPIAAIPRGTETILLVEDDLAVQMVTKVTLTRLGYQVLVASNGHQALRIWQENKQEIQLVLTDMIMPEGLSGKDIALQFKNDRPGIRIIFMSGYSADIAGTDFPQADGDFFIGKPFEMHVLATVIRKSLDTKR
jgi:PAS domain S-box-containing protein